MKATYGALSMLIFQFGLWFVPPDHDPQFMALPAKMQIATIAFCVAVMLAGLVLFLWATLKDGKNG